MAPESNWATRGGLDKIDWANSTFLVLYSNFILDACQVDPTNVYVSPCANPAHNNWWNLPYFWSCQRSVWLTWIRLAPSIYVTTNALTTSASLSHPRSAPFLVVRISAQRFRKC